ncbi:MAG: hypothetical protein H0U95_14110 [Bacteroidetes bacterium]|nr:hypothetical protein [Bacteroidota bacterium]
MKKLINLLSVAVIVSTLISCGGKKKEQEAIVAPQGMNVLDLSKYGKPFAIFVPDTNAAKLTVTEQSSGALDIKVGGTFAITINEQAADIELKKKDIKEDEVLKFKNYVVDEPTAIFWESEIVKPEFHFIVNQKIGTTDYCIEDLKSTETEPFDKATTQKMYDSAKGIKEIKKEEKS